MPEEHPPSKAALLKATAIAMLVAAALLITVVLPAEYGIDPLKTGKLLGLTQIYGSAALPEAAAVSAGDKIPAPVIEGPVAHYAAEFKVDSVEFEIGPYEYIEYKYRLEKGASLMYSWTADAELIHNFHGEPDGKPSSAAESFENRKRSQANGIFTAPFSGIHGWYWENPGGTPVAVKLTTAGFYSAALEIHMDHTTRAHQLTPLGAIAAIGKNSTNAP